MRENYEPLRLSNCPICHGDLKITTIKCKNCGLEMKNEFDLSVFDNLNNNDYEYLIAFLECRGNLKLVQNKLNISYPLAKKKLDILLNNLNLPEENNEVEYNKMINTEINRQSTRASDIIKSKLLDNDGRATFHTLEGKEYDFRFSGNGNEFLCDALPENVCFTFAIFDVVIDFLISQGGKAIKGNARNYKLGDPKCDSSTVAGTIGEHYFHKQNGESILDPVFIIASILDWAGIAENCRGYIKLTPEYKSKIYL